MREEQPGILVNALRPAGLVHMTCAHELGHFFMGHGSTTDQTLDYGSGAPLVELEAEWFAYGLLMPRFLIAKVMRHKGWTTESLNDPGVVYQLSLRLGVSYTAAIWSLSRQNLLSIGSAERLSEHKPRDIKRAIVGADGQAISADVWLLDRGDRDLILEPRPNDRFVVDLPSHATAGFMWSLEDALRDGFVLRPVLEDVRTQLAAPEDAVRIGADRNQRYLLEHAVEDLALVDTSRIDLNFVETQPWRPVSRDDSRFHTSTQFEKIEMGFSSAAKAKLLDEAVRA